VIPDTPPLNNGVCTLVRIEHVSLLVVEASDCGRVAGKVGFADHIGVVESGVDVRGRDDTLGDEALNVMELDVDVAGLAGPRRCVCHGDSSLVVLVDDRGSVLGETHSGE